MPASFSDLTSIEEMERLFELSSESPVCFFKHSVTCGISSGVYREVAGFEGEVALVIVQTARPVSDELAKKTGIRHESPQIIVIKNKVPVYHASHYDIAAADIREAMGEGNN